MKNEQTKNIDSMSEGNRSLTDPGVRASENEYYSAHAWCLNPVPRLDDLFKRFDEEIKLYNTWPRAWQRKESRINFYLFASSMSCIVDDYVFWRPWEPGKVLNMLRKFRFAGSVLLRIADLTYTVSSRMKLARLGTWKSEWDGLLEDTSRLLVKDTEPTAAEFTGLENEFNRLRAFTLPRKLLAKRMRIMEGYRRQDLTHHDLATLAGRFAKSCTARDTHIVVIGPRTAGTYFAPVVKANLEQIGLRKVSWITIRPRKGLFPAEKRTLRRLLEHNPEIVIVDDYSNTGLTFRLGQDALAKLGAKPNKITLLAPLHPTKPEVHLTDNPDTRVITLEHKDLYKTRLLDKENAGYLFSQYLGSREDWDFQSEDNEEIRTINSRLCDHYKDSFQTRLKRVYQLDLPSSNSYPAGVRILGKSVGWGWLGYHAYLAATRTGEFVPELIGLREGILYTRWIDGKPAAVNELTDINIERIGSYVAHRALSLPVGEDPRFGSSDTHSGWREIISVLKGPYVLRTGLLKHGVLNKYLSGSRSPLPSLVDGRMSPEKWIVNGDAMTKIDFEHHNFGEPELDVVDPAYDLAMTSFEFDMSATDEEKLLKAYSELSGDRKIRNRIFLYKLLHTYHVRKVTLNEILDKGGNLLPAELNRRFIRSWNSQIYNMNAYNGRFVRKPARNAPVHRLFFLDLDDVFDSLHFGFPHTTTSGLDAISILHAYDFTVIPNTGRSVEHVRNYCVSYGFPFGIAEYGGVFLKSSSDEEIPLIEVETQRQMDTCRSAIRDVRGAFTDESYHYHIRAYRLNRYGTEPLKMEEARSILRAKGLDKIELLERPDATYFVGKGTGKGAALKLVRERLGCERDRTFAMGDSDADISMLQEAGHGFAPANCSGKIRELARKRECRVVGGYRQRGLMQAVKEIVRSEKKGAGNKNQDPVANDSLREMMLALMARAEQSRLRRLASVLRFNKL